MKYLWASMLVVRAANGQVPSSDRLNSPAVQAPGPPAASYSPPHELLVADIVFIGVIENVARLANEISGLLSAHGITARFEQRTLLREDELAAQEKSNNPSRGTVWILAPNSTAVRLVIADHAHQRFLVRDIPLPEGLDDVARESIGQIIESSLMALSQGATANNRTEAHQATGQYVDATEAAPPPPAVATAEPEAAAPARPNPLPSDQPRASPPSRRTLTQRLGLGYGFNLSGGAFGVEQGPELIAGAELIRRQDSLFATAVFDWHFTQHHRTSEFDLSVGNSRIWLLFGWRKPVRDPVSFVATAGPGITVTRVNSTSNAVGLAAPEPPSHGVTAGARIQSGIEWGNSPLVIQLLLGTDVSFYDTHYDVIRNGTKESLAHPWLVRPGAALGVLWR